MKSVPLASSDSLSGFISPNRLMRSTDADLIVINFLSTTLSFSFLIPFPASFLIGLWFLIWTLIGNFLLIVNFDKVPKSGSHFRQQNWHFCKKYLGMFRVAHHPETCRRLKRRPLRPHHRETSTSALPEAFRTRVAAPASLARCWPSAMKAIGTFQGLFGYLLLFCQFWN